MSIAPQNIGPALATSSSVAWLALLTITHPALDALRVVNNSEPITSRGLVFEPYLFRLVLPQDDSESLPQVSLRVANLDRRIIDFVRSQPTPPSIAIELVTSAFPDLVEKSLTFLKLTAVDYDALELRGRLDVDDFLTQRFPAESYVPPLFPGLFRV